MASVGVAHIGAKCGDLDLNSVTGNQDYSELRSHLEALGKKLQYLLRRRVGGHVVVSRIALEQNIAHASANQKRLESGVLERVANRIGQLSWLHQEIMRLHCGRKYRLFAAKNQAGNIVELPRGTYKFIHSLQQKLQGALRIPIRQIAYGGNPSRVAELFALVIERFDNSIRKKNQRVLRAEFDCANFVGRVHRNSKGHSARVEPLNSGIDARIGPPDDRRIVARVDVVEPPGHRIVLRQYQGRKTHAAEAMCAGIAI